MELAYRPRDIFNWAV